MNFYRDFNIHIHVSVIGDQSTNPIRDSLE